MLNSPVSATLPPARVPDGARVYAVGDIHGRADLLHEMIALIEADAAQAPSPAQHLVFLGDYVDRGRSSKEVIERLLAPFPGFQTTFLMGNHEAALLHFLDNPDFWGRLNPYGATEMLLSYGVRFNPALKGRALALHLHEQFSQLLPPAHRAFISGLALSHTLGDYHFVHAGVNPASPLHAQTPMDLLRIREPFLSHNKPLEKIVVHGHTISAEVEFCPHRIGVDTGAYASGRLSALVLEGENRRFLQT